MGSVALLIALFIAGYFVGVWTAFTVIRQPQRAYEEELSTPVPSRSSGGLADLVKVVELEA
jgi:hypothetical protein